MQISVIQNRSAVDTRVKKKTIFEIQLKQQKHISFTTMATVYTHSTTTFKMAKYNIGNIQRVYKLAKATDTRV